MVIATHAADLLGALTAAGIHGTHRDSGGAEYCGCDEYDSEYRDHPSVLSATEELPCSFLLAELGLALSVSQVQRKEV